MIPGVIPSIMLHSTSIKTYPDYYSTQQDEPLLISAMNLVANDDGSTPLTVTGVRGAYGGNVVLNNGIITFQPTAKTGFVAGFQYICKDSYNNTSYGDVHINITALPDIEAYIYATSSEVSNFISGFEPPSMETIFNSWGRFSSNTWFPSGTTPTGEAASWSYNTSTDTIRSTVNSATVIRFVSDEQLEYYTLEATLSSTSTDDDTIGIVAAFVRVDGTNYALIVSRACGGNSPSWGFKLLSGATFSTLLSADSDITYGYPNSASGSGWSQGSPTRVKVRRNGNTFTAWCSRFGSVDIEPLTEISFDISTLSSTANFIGKQSYGYCAFSQTYASFNDISLVGGLNSNTIYDTESNTVYVYNVNTETWDISPVSIKDSIGYPRRVINPDTGHSFYIDINGNITQLG